MKALRKKEAVEGDNVQNESDRKNGIVWDINQIKKIIPHRYPFLLVDRIVEFDDNKRIIGIKAVSGNEEFFQGHFPEDPVMPGVLILEAMAQVGAILAHKSTKGPDEGSIMLIVGADDVKWKRKVIPGDLLTIEMTFIKSRGPLWILEGEVTVDGQMAASAKISAMKVDKV